MDRAQIEEAYRTYGPMLLRRARTLLGDDQAAKDAMQEVFVRALRAGSSFRGDASPMTWLYRVATNYCLNLVRDGARRRDLLATRGDAREGASAPTEDRLSVAAVLARVPEELREVAVYYYLDDMNHDEIAGILGISRRTVGNRLDAFRSSAQALLGGRGAS